MSEDLSEKIQSLLSDPQTMNMLSTLLGSKNSDNSSYAENTNDEFISNVQNAMAKINNTSDRRINLLNALKPYMRSSRAEGIEKAVKMLKFTQLTSIFKDL